MCMTKIKLCGLSRECDIEAANLLQPEYIGFVFAPKSRRYVSPDRAEVLRGQLSDNIQAVGVFVNEDPRLVAELLESKIIDAAQLHGGEDEAYIQKLRALTDCPIIQAFCISRPEDAAAVNESSADYVLLDSAVGGSGTQFDWSLTQNIRKPYFLAGGLNPDNVQQALAACRPFAVDVSSGIESGGVKDKAKMVAFVNNVRSANK